jgi:hypothetical protein
MKDCKILVIGLSLMIRLEHIRTIHFYVSIIPTILYRHLKASMSTKAAITLRQASFPSQRPLA